MIFLLSLSFFLVFWAYSSAKCIMIYCINICANVQEPFQLQCTVPSFPVIFSIDCMQYVHIWGAFLLLFACCWCGHHSMLYLPIKSLLSFRCWNWRNLQRWFYLFIVISLILLLSTKIMVIIFSTSSPGCILLPFSRYVAGSTHNSS